MAEKIEGIPEKPKRKSFVQIREERLGGAMRAHANNYDPFRQVQMEGFNAAPSSYGGLNFQRFYGRTSYKDLGFSPYIDNEKKLIENTSGWDHFKEAASNAPSLFVEGWVSQFTDKSERQMAIDYGKASNVGSDTRGGAMPVINNAMMNAGYTVGLLSEIAAEEVGLGLIEYFSGGIATPFVMAKTAANTARYASKGMSFSKMANRASSTLGRLKDLRSIANAKTFWKGAAKLGQAVNPLRGTTQFVSRIGRQYTRGADGKIKKLSALAMATRGFGVFYRDTREVNLALAESGLEAGFVDNKVRLELIREHADKFGSHPVGEDMESINEKAAKASLKTYAQNSWLIYATNRIAFGNFFNRYMPGKLGKISNTIRGHGRAVKNFKTGKMEWITHGGKLAYKTFINEAKYAFKKSTLKRLPWAAAKFTGRYTRVNFGEGMQEYFQEVIQHAETKVAKDRYYGGITGAAWYTGMGNEAYMNAYDESLKHFWSAEGAEVFASGFIMGVFAGPSSRVLQTTSKGLGKLGTYVVDRDAYNDNKKYQKEKAADLQFKIEKFNEMTDTEKSFMRKYIEHLTTQAQYKEGMETAEEEGDQKGYVNMKDSALGEQIIFAQEMGAYDLVLEKLKDMAKLSEEELQEAFGKEDASETIKGFKESANKVVSRAEDIHLLSEQFDSLFPDPGEYGVEDSELETGQQLKDIRSARRKVKALTILNQHSLVRTMERIETLSKELYGKKAPWYKKDKSAPASTITVINSITSINEEIDILRSDIESLVAFENPSSKQKKDLKDKEQTAEFLDNLKTSVTLFSQSLHASQELAHEMDSPVNEDLALGVTVRYRSKSNAWQGTIVGERTNPKTGKEQWVIEKVNKKGKTVKQNINKDSSSLVDENALNGQAKAGLEKMAVGAEQQMRIDYENYMKHIGQVYESPVDNVKLEAAFQSYKDIHTLRKDEYNLTQFVDMLLNPKGHVALTERYNEMIKKDNLDEVPRLTEQMGLFLENKEAEDLVKMLFKEYNVFIEETDMLALIKDDIIPEDIHDAVTTIKLREDSIKYVKVQSAIHNWQIETGRVEETAEEKAAREKEETEDASVEGGALATETTEKPVAESEVKDKRITKETPYAKWPQELKDKVVKLKASIEEGRKENGLDVKEMTIEEWVEIQPPAIFAAMFAEYNKQFEKVEEPKKKSSVKPKKEPKGDSEKKSKPPIASDSKVDLKLSNNVKSKIVKGKAGLITIESANALIKQIEGQLRALGVLEKGDTLSFTPGVEFNIEILDENGNLQNILLNSVGKISREELGTKETPFLTEDAAKALGLPTSKDEFHTHPIKTESGTTYYASTENEALWAGGSGKMYSFEVEDIAPVTEIKEELVQDKEAWTNKIKDRLESITQEEDVNDVIDQLNSDNTNRMINGEVYLENEEMETLAKTALEANVKNMKSKDFIAGETYVMKGKLYTFGTAVVKSVNKSKNTVTFQSVSGVDKAGVKLKPKSVKTEDLASVIKHKISTDMSEELSEENVELTSEEKVIKEAIKGTVETFSKDSGKIQDILKKADGISSKEADDNFLDNINCK